MQAAPRTHFEEGDAPVLLPGPSASEETDGKELKERERRRGVLASLAKSLEYVAEGIPFPDFAAKLQSIGFQEETVIRSLFDALDSNQNGRLEPLEVKAALSILLTSNLEEKLAFAFACFDLDKNGQLTKAECYTFCISFFYLGTRVLGILFRKPAEFITELAAKELVNVIFRAVDKDGDIQISADELKAWFASSDIPEWVAKFKEYVIALTGPGDKKPLEKIIDIAEKAGQKVVDLSFSVATSVKQSKVGQKTSEVGTKIGEKAKEIGQSVGETAKVVGGKTKEIGQQVGEKAKVVGGKAKEVGEIALDRTKLFGQFLMGKISGSPASAVDPSADGTE